MSIEIESPILLYDYKPTRLKKKVKKSLTYGSIPAIFIIIWAILGLSGVSGSIFDSVSIVIGIVTGIVILFILVDFGFSKSEYDDEKKAWIVRDVIGDESNIGGYDFINKALEFMGHKTTQTKFYIVTDNSGLVCVHKSVSVLTVNDARRMASKHNISSICIVSCYYSRDYVSSKAKALAKNCGIPILDYRDVLDSVYDKIEPND